VLVHCHANCRQSDVIAALVSKGLWQSKSKWVEWEGIPYHTDWGRPINEYKYRDETGEHLYSVVRFEPKTFRQGYRNQHGKWIWKKHPHQVLYNLPEVLENPIIFICEGEKDCDTLADFGFVATTAAGGSKAPWLDSYTQILREREVILIPDRDPAGYARVRYIGKHLLPPAVARLIYLELEDGKDVTEWFERGHSEVELIAELEGEEACR